MPLALCYSIFLSTFQWRIKFLHWISIITVASGDKIRFEWLYPQGIEGAMMHWNLPQGWPTHVRCVQAHTVAVDIRWFHRAVIDSRATAEVYHATSSHKFTSIFDLGLMAGGVAGHRAEVHLCAAHPITGTKSGPGQTLPVAASYHHKFRQNQDIILVYCMVTLTKMGIVFTQRKSYAVLTKSTLPTEALLRVETITGRIVWRKSNCVSHLDPIVEDKRRVQEVWRSWKIAWDMVCSQLQEMPPEKESKERAIKAADEASSPEAATKHEELLPPQQVGEIRSPHSSVCSDVKDELEDLPHDITIVGPAAPSDEPEQDEDAKMPPEKEGEARSPASVSMPLDTVGQDEQEPEPETARGRGSASSRSANLKRPFEESFPALPSKGTISQRYGKRGGGI